MNLSKLLKKILSLFAINWDLGEGCPYCERVFKNTHGRNIHIGKTKSCRDAREREYFGEIKVE